LLCRLIARTGFFRDFIAVVVSLFPCHFFPGKK
jgi:hypothetical protein